MRPYPNFVGPSYTSQSRRADAEDLINWRVVQLKSDGAKVRRALYPTPGVVSRFVLPQAPSRGLFYQEGRAFAVAGGKLHEFFADLTTIERGDIAQDGNPATLTTNGDGGGQLQITTGNKVYIFTLATNVLTLVVAAGAALMGAMLNGRFVVLDVAQSKISASNVFDGLTWGVFSWIQRSTASDPWKAMLVSSSTSKIYALGEFTSDVLYDTGATPFPFAPISGALIPWGTGAPFSAVDYRGRIMWLAQNKDGDRKVVALAGYSTANVISNEALETALASYASVSDAEGFVYDDTGESAYVLNFPSANATWVYTDEGGWRKQQTWNVATNTYDVWHARNHVLAFGKHLVGDRFTGAVYELSSSFGFDFGGAPLRRVRRTPGMINGLEREFYPGLRLYLDNGMGLLSGQGWNPQVMYRYSNDGGQTFGPYRMRTFGKQGEYRIHVDFLLNGSADDRVDEIVISDPVPARLLGAFLMDDEAA